MRTHRRHVGQLGDGASHAGGVDESDEVEVVASVPVEGHVDAVVQEAHIDADVQLVFLLVGQALVGRVLDLHAALLHAGERSVGLVVAQHQCGVAHRRRSRVGRQRVAALEGEVAQCRAQRAEEALLVGVPCGRDVPCGQPAGLTALAQAVGTLVAVRAVQRVASPIRIGSVGKERGRAVAVVVQRVIVRTVLDALLEELVDVERQFALCILHTPAVEVCLLSVHAAHLAASEEVHDVLPVEDVTPVGREAEVQTPHLVVRLLVDATLRQDADGQLVGVVLVAVQPRVGVADDGIVHGAVRLGLVALLHDLVLAARLRVLHCGQTANFQFFQRFPLQFALKLEVGHVQVDIVVVQFVEDIERRVVARVERFGIQRARGVQGVAVRVDVEVALHLSIHVVHILAHGTRSALLAVAAHGDEVQLQVVVHADGGVHVGRVAFHLALAVPSRVEEGAQRAVEVDFLGAARYADGMVVLDGIGEELSEPVGVPVLRLTQVGVLRRLVVQQTVHPSLLVVGVDELVHASEDTALRGPVRVGKVQPTLVAHLAIDSHLLLRVHDVEVAVGWYEAHRIFARVGDMALAGLAPLRGDDDHACHGTCAVDAGGRAVLQDLERLDVVGVESCDGR